MGEFELLARLASQVHDYVAVCRCKYGGEDLFAVPFENREQLSEFLRRNNGDVKEIGFYAKGYVEGEYIGENT